MTDSEIQRWLKENGYPEHVWKGGRAGLIQGWKKFVDEVEAGYEFGLYDYRNDLDGRALIARLGLETEVAAEDARLKELLIATDKRIWKTEPVDGFWNLGYPAKIGDEFREDLKAEGLA